MDTFVNNLSAEHAVIHRVLRGMNAVADLLATSRRVEPTVLADFVAFFKIFVGQCHNAKEERFLFPLLVCAGGHLASQQIGTLEMEHQKTAELIEELAELSIAYPKPVVRSKITRLLRALAALYLVHMWKEECLLLPMAQRTIARSEQELLLDSFRKVESGIGNDVHTAFEILANNLAEIGENRTELLRGQCSSAA